MKISILNEKFINDTKGGYPVYIKGVIDVDNLSEFAFVCQETHIAISVFKDDYRKGENWISSDFLAVDFDDGKVTSKEIHDLFKNLELNHIIIASKNHLKDKNDGKGIIERFHIFIPFNQSITNDTELYRFIASYFVKRFKYKGWDVDESVTKDKCRYYFKHRETLFNYENGKNIDIQQMIDEKKRIERLQKKLEIKKKSNPKKIEKVLTKKWETVYKPMLSVMGQRHNGVVSAAGYLKTLGFDESEAFDLITNELGSYSNDVPKAIRWVYNK